MDPRAIAVLAFASLASAQQYAGSKACSGCHREIYQHWVRSPMGRSITPASEHLKKIPARIDVDDAKLKRRFSAWPENGAIVQSESSADFEAKHAIKYAIGSGENGLSFIVERDNHLFQAPLSFYSRTKGWQLSPGYEFADYGFSRPIAIGCIACHSGRPQPVAQVAGRFQQPAFQELAIGCENCHGPGAAHAKSAGKGAIVNPAKLSPRLSEDVCMNCHQGGDTRIPLPGKTELDFRPGQPLSDTVAIFRFPQKTEAAGRDLLEHHEAMRASRCFQASAGKMTCLTCHNPHGERNVRQACLGCHTQPLAKTHPARTSDCLGCHMPKRDIGIIAHSALTNHRIVRTPDQPYAAAQTEPLVHFNATAGKKLPDITLLRAYSQLLERDPSQQTKVDQLMDAAFRGSPDDPLLLGGMGRRALRNGDLDTAVSLLTKSMANGSITAAVFEDLAEALSRKGQLEQAVETLKQGIGHAPFVPSLRKSLALRYIKLQRYADAKTILEDYVARFPEDDFIRRLLRQVNSKP